MGVVHKLREDVVSFIITLKRNNPSIGVRQLADLTGEQFHIKISKSSISNVLQKENLNSAVGRRSGVRGRTDKFTIPAVRKEQISRNMEKAGFVRSDRPAPQKEILSPEQVDRPEPIKEKKEPAQPEKASVEKPMVRQDTPGVVDPDDTAFLASVDETRKKRMARAESVSKGLGFVFLKAAQWDISSRSLIAELMTKYSRAPGSDRFDAVSDMYMFLRFLGTRSAEDLSEYEGHGLWALNGLNGPGPDDGKLAMLFQLEKTVAESATFENFIMEYERAKEQSFLEVTGYKLLLEDRSELSMDASLVSFAEGRTVPAFPQSNGPLQKAMGDLSDCLISNISSAVFLRIPGEAAFDRAFYDMAAVFENVPGKRILRVAVMDQQGGEIAGFSTIPFQKRTFLAGVGPQQKEFFDLTKNARSQKRRPFYHQGADRVVYYAEAITDTLKAKTNQKIGDFRVIALWNDRGSVPMWAIITNHPTIDAGMILGMYMSRWPCLEKTERIVMVRDDLQESAGPIIEKRIFNEPAEILENLVTTLHVYCQNHFFPQEYADLPVNHLITNVYNTPGTLLVTENEQCVFLDAGTDPAHRKNMTYAAQRVNERRVFDPSGRRLWISC